eukprot:4438177-Pyramimonas_sp.AAC.1
MAFPDGSFVRRLRLRRRYQNRRISGRPQGPRRPPHNSTACGTLMEGRRDHGGHVAVPHGGRSGANVC